MERTVRKNTSFSKNDKILKRSKNGYFLKAMDRQNLQEGGIGEYKKPQNLTNNNKQSQNRNKFRSKPKTASKIREAVHAVEILEAHIFRRETGKTPNSIE